MISTLIRKHLGVRNHERALILGRALRQVRGTFGRVGHPVPLAQIRSALEASGIGRGSLVLVHSSPSALMRAWPVRDPGTPRNALAYCAAVIDTLLDVLGPEGTLLMPTEAVADLVQFSQDGRVFDYRRAPSRRGLITELFRRRREAFRSVLPWYNATGVGPLAEPLIARHEDALPFAMGAGSPWLGLTERQGHVALLGCDFDTNSMMRLPEMTLNASSPLPVFFDKLVPARYTDREGTEREGRFAVRARRHLNGELEAYSGYLQERYDLYRKVPLGATWVRSYRADRQYDALCREVERGVWPFKRGG